MCWGSARAVFGLSPSARNCHAFESGVPFGTTWLVASNPFAEVSAKSVVRLDQRRFVTQEETTKLLYACPNHHWRSIVALARYGGLRCPSEVLSLRWQDIDWDKQRINVPRPRQPIMAKRAIIPLFPSSRCRRSLGVSTRGAIYVVDERYRMSSNGSNGWRNCTPHDLEKIVRRAGLVPWPKLFHAMRSSRETELAQDFPIHVVTAWLGNTPTIAMRHYLLTTNADFERAAGGKTRTEKAVQNPVQQSQETSCNEEQPENGNRDISEENDTLHPGATYQSGEDRIRTCGPV